MHRSAQLGTFGRGQSTDRNEQRDGAEVEGDRKPQVQAQVRKRQADCGGTGMH